MEFLDDLGRELDAAAGRVIRAQRQRRRRNLLVPAAGIAAAIAVAVALWPAAPADPEREVGPAQATSAAELLAVLRRPESDADRGPEAARGRERLAALIEGEATFRLLQVTPDGHGVVLAAGPVERLAGGADADGVCLHVPGRGDEEGGGACWTASDVRLARAHVQVGRVVAGLVPDGVSSVEVRFVDSHGEGTQVEDNLFSVPGPDRMPVLSVTMRDAEGRAVAQDHPAARAVQVAPVPMEAVREAFALTKAAEPPATEAVDGLQAVLAAAADARHLVPHPPGAREEYDWERRSPRSVAAVRFDRRAPRPLRVAAVLVGRP